MSRAASGMTIDSRLRVSKHAALRWLHRVNAEGYPKREIRSAYDRARRVERDDVDGWAYHDPRTRVTMVQQDNEIVTLWREIDRHGGGGETA